MNESQGNKFDSEVKEMKSLQDRNVQVEKKIHSSLSDSRQYQAGGKGVKCNWGQLNMRSPLLIGTEAHSVQYHLIKL